MVILPEREVIQTLADLIQELLKLTPALIIDLTSLVAPPVAVLLLALAQDEAVNQALVAPVALPVAVLLAVVVAVVLVKVAVVLAVDLVEVAKNKLKHEKT
jgi:uncharacterized Tic20 family protein